MNTTRSITFVSPGLGKISNFDFSNSVNADAWCAFTSTGIGNLQDPETNCQLDLIDRVSLILSARHYDSFNSGKRQKNFQQTKSDLE